MSTQAPATAPTTVATGFAAAIEAWVKAEWTKIVAVAEELAPTIENDLEIGLEALASIAGNAVLAQATSAISGAEKLSTAVTSVIQTVEASGKTVATQTAQMAVQQVYLAVQGATAPAA